MFAPPFLLLFRPPIKARAVLVPSPASRSRSAILGPWRVTFTQHFVSNGPRRLAFPPPASPTEPNWVAPEHRARLGQRKVSIKQIRRPTTEGWQRSQQAVLWWRPPTTTEDASAPRPAAALVAARSTAGRSSLTIQDSPSRTRATGGPVSSSGSSRG